MSPELRSPLAVVCHDAGACNVILPWLRRPDLSLRPVMDGPAARLFRGRFGAAAPTGSGHELEAALDGAAMLLSGTGWASDLEHRARRLARQRGLFSAAVIDHWINYPMRFERAGETVWPDEFWVTDEGARAIAERCFPGAVIRCFDNQYLRAEAAAIAPLPRWSHPAEQASNAPDAPDAPDAPHAPHAPHAPRAPHAPQAPHAREARSPTAPGQVLYVLEPMRNDWGRGVPGEFQALDHFMSRRVAAGMPATAPVRLRPHPSDPPGKYDAWIAAQRGRAVASDIGTNVATDVATDVALDRHATLAGAIGASTWVVGCESFALVVALAAGRRVCTSLPPWAPPCRLPHAGIVRLGAVDLVGA